MNLFSGSSGGIWLFKWFYCLVGSDNLVIEILDRFFGCWRLSGHWIEVFSARDVISLKNDISLLWMVLLPLLGDFAFSLECFLCSRLSGCFSITFLQFWGLLDDCHNKINSLFWRCVGRLLQFLFGVFVWLRLRFCGLEPLSIFKRINIGITRYPLSSWVLRMIKHAWTWNTLGFGAENIHLHIYLCDSI